MQNIYERQKMFEQLGIDESRRENSTIKKKPNINKKKKVMDENQEPVRKSARIAGGVPEIERFTPNFDDYAADEEYVSRPRRRLALENYNDYLHATKTFTGNENPETLSEVQKERFKILPLLSTNHRHLEVLHPLLDHHPPRSTGLLNIPNNTSSTSNINSSSSGEVLPLKLVLLQPAHHPAGANNSINSNNKLLNTNSSTSTPKAPHLLARVPLQHSKGSPSHTP